MQGVTIQEILEKDVSGLRLELLNEGQPGRRPISTADLNRPGLALVGFTEGFLWERIQIFGQTEVRFLLTRTEEEIRSALTPIFAHELPCIILTRQLDPPAPFLDLAAESGIPVLRTPELTTEFMRILSSNLEEMFAPTTTLHGSLVDVYGVGLLLTGRSAIGKSEVALDLLERGHRLVADDVVMIQRRARNVIIGRGNELLRHCMEIRGIGIIDVQAIFGIRAVRAQKRVEVEVHLKEWEKKEEYERLGLEDRTTDILGVEIPLAVIPLFPGKNITVIAETIAMNYLLKAYGYNPAEHFNDRLQELLRRKANLEILAKDDME